MSDKKNKREAPVKNEPTAEELFSAIASEQGNPQSVPGPSAQDTSGILKNLQTMVHKLYQMANEKSKFEENSIRMLSELQVKTDSIGQTVSHIQNKLDKSTNDSIMAGPSTPIVEKCPFKPVNSLEDLVALDKNAADPDFVRKTVKTLGCIHGKNRCVGDGGSVCLRIFDSFFNRKFMLNCSWTGTGKNKKKIAFLGYTNIIMLYFTVVHHSDPTFTVDATEKFLHRCLRNAKQRSTELSGKKATSRKRKRAAKEPSETSSEDESEDQTFQAEGGSCGAQANDDKENDPEGQEADPQEVANQERDVGEGQQEIIHNSQEGGEKDLGDYDLKIEFLDEAFL